MPTQRESDFLDDLDSGDLDLMLEEMMQPNGRPRQLLVNAQIGEGGLWHDVRPDALLPAERLADGTVPRVSVRAARRAYLRSLRTQRR